MIVFPAVDIKDGKCVRLRQGKADESTVFEEDPVKAALHWQSQGAAYLHLIDLDGAFDGRPVNLQLIKDICATLVIPVQVGGGIRDLETARHYISAGVRRVIIGTAALADPEGFAAICAAFPGKVGVSLDAENGRLKTKGWVEDSGLSVRDVLPRLAEAGASFIIYTDIARDGMQSGVNFEALKKLALATHIPVIAAGGVHTLDDIKLLYPLTPSGSLQGSLQGVISGRALYEGALNLPEALAWIAAQN